MDLVCYTTTLWKNSTDEGEPGGQSGKGGSCQSGGIKRGHKRQPREDVDLARKTEILWKRDDSLSVSDRGLSGKK
jgi:hypothetical protein